MMRWDTYDDEGAPALPYGFDNIGEMVAHAEGEIIELQGDLPRNALTHKAAEFIFSDMKGDEAERIFAVAFTLAKHSLAFDTRLALYLAMIWERG